MKISINSIWSCFCLLLLGCVACTTNNVENQITFKQVDPLTKVFRESNFFPEFTSPAEVAAGESATFQFALRAGMPLKDLCLEVTKFENEKGQVFNDSYFGFVDYVKAERLINNRSKDAYSPLSAYYPDPIIEKQHWDVERDVAQPLWLTAKVPTSAQPGNYKATFALSGKLAGESFRLTKEVAIKVYPVVMQEPDLWVTNWFTTSPSTLKVLNGNKDVEPYSEAYWKMIKEIADKLKLCHSNTILISPFEHITCKKEGDKYTFDFTNFDKFAGLFHEVGALKMIEGGHIASKKDNKGQFQLHLPKFDGKGTVEQRPLDDPETKDFYQQFFPAFYKHIKEVFPEVMYSQHIGDEPTDKNVASYIDIAKFIKGLCPDIKLIDACLSHKLNNILDIWVPEFDGYCAQQEFYDNRKKEGDEVWFYTCLNPQGEYANRFLELPLLKTRVIHWLNFKYYCKGYLHWGFNWWNQNPYGETTIIFEWDDGNVGPGGDPWIIYPDNGKVYGSIRLEAMRDGIADYTLLRMLEKKKPEVAKELCRLVAYTKNHYDIERDHFRMIRRTILEELSKPDKK